MDSLSFFISHQNKKACIKQAFENRYNWDASTLGKARAYSPVGLFGLHPSKLIITETGGAYQSELSPVEQAISGKHSEDYVRGSASALVPVGDIAVGLFGDLLNVFQG